MGLHSLESPECSPEVEERMRPRHLRRLDHLRKVDCTFKQLCRRLETVACIQSTNCAVNYYEEHILFVHERHHSALVEQERVRFTHMVCSE